MLSKGAFVADYNFLFNDVHFVDYENYGLGKQIGGKIGVIQDPFGAATYPGATTAIPGVALDQITLDHLTLGPDGMLYADVPMEEVSDAGEQMFKSLFVRNAAELVEDALAAQERGQSLSGALLTVLVIQNGHCPVSHFFAQLKGRSRLVLSSNTRERYTPRLNHRPRRSSKAMSFTRPY